MKKIYPFYKNENIANNPLGYTSVACARKRMRKEKIIEDFLKTLPEDYWLDYSWVYELEYPWDENIKPDVCYNVSTSYGYFGICYYTQGYHKHGSKTKLKLLPKEIYDLFTEFRGIELKCIEHNENNENNEDKERYRTLLFTILKNGYFPHLYKDETNFRKSLSKFINDNVDFREMEVNISIKDI